MKRILLLIVLFIGVFVNAQIKVVENIKPELIGEIAPMKKLQFKIEKNNDEYIFTYADVKFKLMYMYKSFSIKDIDNDFNNLYNIIIDGLENTPKEPVILELPSFHLWLNFTKTMGVSNVQIEHSDSSTGIVGYSIWLTKERVDKLFGK